jgi:hypothetical protein
MSLTILKKKKSHLVTRGFGKNGGCKMQMQSNVER